MKISSQLSCHGRQKIRTGCGLRELRQWRLHSRCHEHRQRLCRRRYRMQRHCRQSHGCRCHHRYRHRYRYRCQLQYHPKCRPLSRWLHSRPLQRTQTFRLRLQSRRIRQSHRGRPSCCPMSSQGLRCPRRQNRSSRPCAWIHKSPLDCLNVGASRQVLFQLLFR